MATIRLLITKRTTSDTLKASMIAFVNPYDCVFFVLCSRRFSQHERSTRTTFGKLCQRPIEMEEFPEECRSLNFRARVIGRVYVGCLKNL